MDLDYDGDVVHQGECPDPDRHRHQIRSELIQLSFFKNCLAYRGGRGFLLGNSIIFHTYMTTCFLVFLKPTFVSPMSDYLASSMYESQKNLLFVSTNAGTIDPSP